MRIIVTGGAGFIGTNLIRSLLDDGYTVVNLDKLTYASNFAYHHNLNAENKNYHLREIDICSQQEVLDTLLEFQPTVIFHLAAETHVDNSIVGSEAFIQTNVVGTHSMLQASKDFISQSDVEHVFKFIHVSTDEVYGSLSNSSSELFKESTAYAPNSPYAASKAGSDHLVRAFHQTYDLPVIITNCSNNFGPFQHKEKFIPKIIECCLLSKPIPVYGQGNNIRDWLYVADHVSALKAVYQRGHIGKRYNIGSRNERTNLDIVKMIITIFSQLTGRSMDFESMISFVPDRLGHDFRYAIDASLIERELSWKSGYDFTAALRECVSWYLYEHQMKEDI